jgi:pyridoxamine 5'-phosphate oxidase family protein
MTLTDAEQRFLTRQDRGHLSTIGPDGVPQVKPLGFSYNAALESIDITGFNMAGSAKYRNVKANPRVAFVVDEVTEPTMEGAHFLEIRGIAETVTETETETETETGPAPTHLAPDIIRIHPRRIIAYNVDPKNPGLQTRDVAPRADRPDAA